MIPTVFETGPQWMARHLPFVWIICALVLAGAEMLTQDFTLLMMALGAAAGGLTALIVPDMFWLQAVVAATVAVFSLLVVRPNLLRRVRSAPGYQGAMTNLVGRQAIARGPISHDSGSILLNGDTWSARTVDRDTFIPEGALVDVYEVDGTHVIVQAIDPMERQLPGSRPSPQD